MSRTPYRNRKGASPLNAAGQLQCDRCGQVPVGWPLHRPDNCGGGVSCLRQPAAIRASWQRYGFSLAREVEAGEGCPSATEELTLPPVPRVASPAPVVIAPLGLVYLLHFTTPYKHAKHYLGATGKTLDARLSAHRGGECAGDRDGRPAKLIQALLGAGGDFIVARTWATATRRDAFVLERALKKRGGRGRLCPVCRPGITIAAATKGSAPCDG